MELKKTKERNRWTICANGLRHDLIVKSQLNIVTLWIDVRFTLIKNNDQNKFWGQKVRQNFRFFTDLNLMSSHKNVY
jgi:hypothetical protein